MVAQNLFAQVRAARNPAGAAATGSKARKLHSLLPVPWLRNRLLVRFGRLVVPDRRPPSRVCLVGGMFLFV